MDVSTIHRDANPIVSVLPSMSSVLKSQCESCRSHSAFSRDAPSPSLLSDQSFHLHSHVRSHHPPQHYSEIALLCVPLQCDLAHQPAQRHGEDG